MLSLDPTQRPTAAECLQHKFFTNWLKKVNASVALTNLLNFRGENNLEYLLKMYASLNMTSSLEKTEYLTEFYNLDLNGDG